MTPSIIYFPLMVTMGGSLKPGVPAELLEGLEMVNCRYLLRTGKEIRFRFWLSEDKAGKEAKRRPTGW